MAGNDKYLINSRLFFWRTSVQSCRSSCME